MSILTSTHHLLMTHDEYLTCDGLELARLVGSGAVLPSELLDIALQRARGVGRDLNAVVRVMEDEARDTIRRSPLHGPFAGVPFLLKDLLSLYAGVPTTHGSRLLAHWIPHEDTELVRRYRAAGLVVMGKTNTPEFGLLPYTEPELFGPAHNPWNPDRVTGGSSGGSAAAVAAGVVPLAGGGDGGGSIRIPASCCGLFGLKPTRGRTPTGPTFGQLWRGSAVEHVLTRSVRDSAAVLDAISGPEAGDPYVTTPPPRPFLSEVQRDPGALRIAFTTTPMLGTRVHPDCRAAARDAAELLSSLGHELVEVAPDVDRDAFRRAFLVMVCGELGADVAYAGGLVGREPKRQDLEPATWALTLLSDALTAREYAEALRTLEHTGRVVGRFFQDYDLLLTPTLATPPPPVGSLKPTRTEQALLRVLGSLGSGRLFRLLGTLDQLAGDAFEFIPWTPVFNVTGQPAMSVPLAWNDEGLPVGSHLVGRFGDEATLFRVAGQLERARPWFDRIPPAARAAAPTT